MKKIISFISIVAALVFSASCNKETFLPEGANGLLTIRLQTSELETRATVPGEGIENTVTHADFFFFSDAQGTTLLNHTRLEVKAGELVAKSGNIYEYKFDVSSENNPLQKTSYLYVIANYPETITEDTLEGILGLDIKTDLSGELSSFVMDSYNSATQGYLYQLTPTKKEDDKTFTIDLRRAAAKLVLTINVADSFTDESENVWTPVTNQMWVNFINARKVATVEAEAVEFDEKASYFNTAQVAPTSATAASSEVTTWKVSPVYTYPQSYATSDVTAPYFKIFCPWKCTKYNMANFYYKIVLPELGSFQRNKVYNLTVNLSTIGGDQDDWALVSDYIYVADWWAPEKIESSFEGAMYLDVPVKYYEIYGIDYVDIPVVSSNNIQINTGVTSVTGTKTNLYNGQTQNVTASISNLSKDGFRLTHVLNDDITSTNYDCTPITYTFNVRHIAGGLSKTIPVTVVQYPSIYVSADESNGYAYVNSYTRGNNRGGRYQSTGGWNASPGAWNSRGTNYTGSDQIGTMNNGNASNNNYNQYVVTVSVLPEGYKVAGMSEDVVIGDPRGGQLANNYLGYAAGTNGARNLTVQANYNAVSSTSQNVIAPAIRVASSWGATSPILDYNRAEERCASYQENGYPAGRWRMPTIAEIDFLIRLSNYNHIPELFSPSREGARDYDVYWAGGSYAYGGTPYLTDTQNQASHTQSYVNLTGATQTTQDNRNVLRISVNGRYEYFCTYMRCVYDEWYWSSQKYGNNGQPTTGNAATQWLGYIY